VVIAEMITGHRVVVKNIVIENEVIVIEDTIGTLRLGMSQSSRFAFLRSLCISR
jgi:hypothetical protein